MKKSEFLEKSITVNYGVHVGYAYAAAYIIQDGKKDFILRLSRKSEEGAPVHLKSRHYKSLWSAIRASRKWIHDVIGTKVKEAEEN